MLMYMSSCSDFNVLTEHWDIYLWFCVTFPH
jgi:hypothetical protein